MKTLRRLSRTLSGTAEAKNLVVLKEDEDETNVLPEMDIDVEKVVSIPKTSVFGRKSYMRYIHISAKYRDDPHIATRVTKTMQDMRKFDAKIRKIKGCGTFPALDCKRVKSDEIRYQLEGYLDVLAKCQSVELRVEMHKWLGLRDFAEKKDGDDDDDDDDESSMKTSKEELENANVPVTLDSIDATGLNDNARKRRGSYHGLE
eukprot:g2922.t1